MSDQVIVTITEIAEQAIVELTEVSESVVVVIQEAANGDTGPIGPTGASGGSTNAWSYNAKTNATSGYPGNGYLLWNNATQTSATSIIVSHLTDDNTDIEFLLSFFVVNQKIFIQDRDNSSNNQVWQITGTPTVTSANTSTAYYTFPVTLVSSAGAAFTNNHSLLFGQIAVATNSVTSATTSDGTAELLVANLSFLNGEFITTLSSNQTDDRTVVMPNADGTLVVGGGTASGTNTGDQDLSGYALTSSLGTGAAFDTAPTANPSTEEVVTTAVSQTLTNKTLTSPAINSATFGTAATFNATTYTFGAGAAAAMNTALGLNSAASLTNTDLERSINANSLNFMPPVTFFDDMDGNYGYTASNIGAGGSGPADFSNFGSRTHGVYGIRTLATISAGRMMFARIPSSAGYVAGSRFRACFAISDVANCNFFAGFSWVGVNVSGLVYRSAFNSGQFVFARAMNTDYTGGTFYTFTTEVPQAGDFTLGKRYIVDFTMETLTSCRIKLYIADYNLSNWTEIANSVVTLPSTLVNPAPTFSVQTTAAAIKTLWVDWVSVEQPNFIR